MAKLSLGLGRALTAVALLAIGAAPAVAQTPLFSDNSELQVTIDGPIGELVRTAARSTDPFPAVVTLHGLGEPQRYDIELSARGFSRRTGGICNFPPIRLDFDRSALRGTILERQNRLKLVTRCRAGRSYEQLTVLEYLAYRMYNEITPHSYRVRPVSVTYRDNNGRRREETQFNFLIEDVDDVARRNGLVAIDVLADEVRSAQLDANASAIVGLFQYMLGNLDWDMVSGHAGEECCHNGKLMAASQAARDNVVPIPYDFDYSGFVNAPYAIPPESIRVPNVRTRYYRGYCRHNDALPAAIERFRERRAAIFALIDGETRLTDARRRTARRFIEEFYAVIDDPDRVQNQLIERCRG